MSEKHRASFEQWASSPPREFNIDRNTDDAALTAWPGDYTDYATQCAWEAWSYVCDACAKQRGKINE